MVSNSGDTLSELYESSDYSEQYAIDTARWYESCSSSSVNVASVRRGFSRPPSSSDSERTKFRFDPDQVSDVDSNDPWFQTPRLQDTDRIIGPNHPTPDVVLPAVRRCPRANITSWRSCDCVFCNGPASWWELGLMIFHCLAIIGLWGVLIFSIVQLFQEGAHVRQSDPVTVMPDLE